MAVTLEVDAVTRLYGEQRALDGISFRIESGEFVALVGPSGCGKSTTLRITAGLELPSSGSVRFDGRDMTAVGPAEREIGFVFQQVALYPRSTVEENLRLPLQARGMSRRAARARAGDMAQRLGIEPLLARAVETLSGGEQQRVAVGRALVRRPRLLLLDEPLASLDVGWKHELRELLIDLHSEERMTVVYVTHDPLEVASLAHRVLVLERGRLVQAGTLPELALNPESLFVAQHTTWLPLNVGELVIRRDGCKWRGNFADLAVSLTGATNHLSEGQRLYYSLRPTDIRVSLEGNLPPERTAEIQGVRLARVSAYGRSWWCRVDAGMGSGIWLDFAQMTFFDSAGRRIDLQAVSPEGEVHVSTQPT